MGQQLRTVQRSDTNTEPTDVLPHHTTRVRRAPTVLSHVRNLKKDQEITVHREDGTSADFAVDSVGTFQDDKFPRGRVHKNNGKSELRLSICGGEFAKDRHWDSTVVVFADLKDKIGAWTPGAAR